MADDPIMKQIPAVAAGLRGSLRVPMRRDGHDLRRIELHVARARRLHRARRAGGDSRRGLCRPGARPPGPRRRGRTSSRSTRAGDGARTASAHADRPAVRARPRCAAPDGGRLGGLAAGSGRGRPGRANRHDGAPGGRIGNRQGGPRPLDPWGVATRRGPLPCHQLRRAARTADRVGAVRARTRRLHRRHAGACRPDRTRRRRRAAARRGGRALPGCAGQVAARAAGTRVPAARRRRGCNAPTCA